MERACWLGLNEMSWWLLGDELELEWQVFFHPLSSHQLREAPVTIQSLLLRGANHCVTQPLAPSCSYALKAHGCLLNKFCCIHSHGLLSGQSPNRTTSGA